MGQSDKKNSVAPKFDIITLITVAELSLTVLEKCKKEMWWGVS